MDISIPVAPLGVIILINFFAPYAISLLTAPFWPKAAKKWISVAISLGLAALALIGYYVLTGLPLPSWPILLLTGVVVTQASYSAILKDSADSVALTSGLGSKNVTAIAAYQADKAQAALNASATASANMAA